MVKFPPDVYALGFLFSWFSEERIVSVDMNVDNGMEFILSAGFMGKGEQS